jgi:hypothetical protein
VAALPHDLTDLYFAPVVLAIDSRIAELGLLDAHKLASRVAVAGDVPDFTRDLREEGLLRAIQHLIDTHNWELALDARGVRLTHGDHTVVLGVPPTFSEYLAGGQQVPNGGADV